ncbi:transposase [bacterium]|nr:transposase [bacterium]MBU1754108.1 transposase [bacterium]
MSHQSSIKSCGKASNCQLKRRQGRCRLQRLKCAIEAKISLAKRKYGLNRINYRIQNGEEIWIRMGLLAMNLKKAMNYR